MCDGLAVLTSHPLGCTFNRACSIMEQKSSNVTRPEHASTLVHVMQVPHLSHVVHSVPLSERCNYIAEAEAAVSALSERARLVCRPGDSQGML